MHRLFRYAAAVAGRSVATPPPADPFAHLNDVFSVGASDPTARTHDGRAPWQWYRPAAAEVGVVVGGRLRIVPVEGGGAAQTDDPHSWWYSNGGGFRRSGMLVFKEVGPGAAIPTPRDFSARARCRVSNEAGSGPPPSGPFVWTFGGLAIHSPERGPSFVYDHAALGTDPPGGPRRLEGKTTQGNVSTFPTEDALDGAPGDPLEYDVRIDRVGPLVDMYFRPISSGEVLASNSGWATHSVGQIDHTTGAPGPVAEALPDTLQIGLMAYSSAGGPGAPSAADIMLEVDEFLVMAA